MSDSVRLSPGNCPTTDWAAEQKELARKGRDEEALAVCRRLCDARPADAAPWVLVGDRLAALGRLGEAAGAYRKAQERVPDDEDAAAGLAYVGYLEREAKAGRGRSAPGGENTGERPVPQDGAGRPRGGQEERLTASLRTRAENLALNHRERADKRLRMRSLPPQLTIESTTRCNFYCRTCAKGYGPYHAEDLSGEVLERVRREIMPTVTHTGITGYGEPMLSRRFDAMLDMALEAGATVHLVTNGSLLTFRRIERLVSSPVSVAVSCDGATAQVFEAIRSGGRFEQVCRRLAWVKRVRTVRAASDRSRFVLNFVGLRRNIHELPDVVRLAARYGLEGVHFEDYVFGGRPFDEESLRFDPALANRWMARAREVAREEGVELKLPPDYVVAPATEAAGGSLWRRLRAVRGLWSAPDRLAQQCHSPWSEPYVTTSGVVTPCCMSGAWLGDLTRTPFARIWNGWRYRLLRWRVRGALPPLVCRDCTADWGINAGNPGNARVREGLIVKAVYYGEIRLRRTVGWVRGIAEHLTGADRRRRAAAAPNYDRGRPIRRGELAADGRR